MFSSISKAARRQVADEFKQRKVRRGIFAVRCPPTGEVWVGSSPNLDAAQNSLWFQLRGGLHRIHSLQQAWTSHGESAFGFEVLEQFEDDVAAILLADLSASRKKHWAEVVRGSLL